MFGEFYFTIIGRADIKEMQRHFSYKWVAKTGAGVSLSERTRERASLGACFDTPYIICLLVIHVTPCLKIGCHTELAEDLVFKL